ncbi:hypothetical protein, partial [Photorhabdus namnaonensis]|uniref:hypothetical protein n=1 Tax=Photorhabdus namnaonensis TaxID=1851568 RepID=UPI001969F6E7
VRRRIELTSTNEPSGLTLQRRRGFGVQQAAVRRERPEERQVSACSEIGSNGCGDRESDKGWNKTEYAWRR